MAAALDEVLEPLARLAEIGGAAEGLDADHDGIEAAEIAAGHVLSRERLDLEPELPEPGAEPIAAAIDDADARPSRQLEVDDQEVDGGGLDPAGRAGMRIELPDQAAMLNAIGGKLPAMSARRPLRRVEGCLQAFPGLQAAGGAPRRPSDTP